jgi:hypothetical protein
MTTCAECLTAISTSRISDLQPGSAVALHCATCADCSRVAEEVRYAEYRLATALNEQRSGLDSSDLTVAAMRGSERLRRLRVGRWIRRALVVAAGFVFSVFVVEQRTQAPAVLRNGADALSGRGEAIETRTITLKCITPEQATALATPYLRSKAAIYPVPGISAITVRAKLDEFNRALNAIEEFDLACQLPRATTPSPATSPAKPGRD